MAQFIYSEADAINGSFRCDISTLDPLRSLIIGPMAGLHRYNAAAEKAAINLGVYNPSITASFNYPGRSSTSIVDKSYIKLWLENAYLNYWNDYQGTGSTITPVTNFPNQIQSSSINFKTYTAPSGTVYARDASFYDRDVTIGDQVLIRGQNGGNTYQLWTSVTGFVNAVVAANTAVATSGSSNKTTQTLTTTIAQVGGTPLNDIAATATGTNYESSADGFITRTYTITVIQSSSGMDATTALISVKSADGGDDVASVAPATFGSPTAIGAKGLTVTFSKQNNSTLQNNAIAAGILPDDLVAGQKWTVTVGENFTAPTATSSGTYTGTADTKYILKVTRGGTVPTVNNPTTAPTAGAATAGGSLTAGTYKAVYTFVNANGETSASPESANFTTSAGNLTIPLTLPALPTGATSINVYLTPAGGATGTEVLYATGITTTSYNAAIPVVTSNPAPPTSNTCVVSSRVGKEPLLTVTTTTGIDSAAPAIIQAKGQALAVGTYGVKVSFDQAVFCKGDTYYISVTAASKGAIKTLVLANDLPSQLLSASDLDLRLFIKEPLINLQSVNPLNSAVNWTSTSTSVTVNSNITTTDPTWTNGGVEMAIPIYQATMYLEYREWLTSQSGQILSFNDPNTVSTTLGLVDPDNPIAYSVYKALQNTAGNILGNTVTVDPSTSLDVVRCVVLSGEPTGLDTTYAAWNSALSLITNVDRVYNLVPLTTDTNVHTLVVNHIKQQADPTVGFRKKCLLPVTVQTNQVIVNSTTTSDGTTALATLIQDPAITATSFTYLRVPAGNAKFVTNGVQPGDIVRYQYGTDASGNPTYTQYIVDSVVSEDSLRLTSGNSVSINTPQRVEIWRNLTTDQIVTNLLKVASGWSYNKVQLVWPDTAEVGGVSVPGYYVAAAIAGLMGSVPSHQSLTNVQLTGFDSFNRSTLFMNMGQLLKLAAGGITVVSQAQDGTSYIMKCVTTDTASLNTLEEMVVRNTDMLSIAFEGAWTPYLGNTNNNQQTMQAINTSFVGIVGRLKQINNVPRLGPALYDATITLFQQHPTLQDHLQLNVTVSGPFPLNQVDLTVNV